MQIFLLLLLLSRSSLQALPNCAAGATCPPEGIWSEWVTKDKCTTDCGSCSKQFYTRECISKQFNCDCVGDAHRLALCNTETCKYPAQRTCCIPYVPMLINGSMQCGPLLKHTVKPVTSCCPVGGTWSKWSSYGRNDANTMWISTRTCISEKAGCPCSDAQNTIQTKTECPCRAMIDVERIVTMDTNNQIYPVKYSIDHNTCLYTGYMQLSSGGRPCNAYTFDGYKRYDLASVIRYQKTQKVAGDGPYVDFRVNECNGYNGHATVTFYCNLTDLYWRLIWNDVAVNGWAQINI